jgi:hypothetical protein
MQITAKTRTTIMINKALLDKAREIGINIIAFTEVKLAEFVKDLGAINSNATDTRAYGLVGYDVAFTRRRSPVRIRLSP